MSYLFCFLFGFFLLHLAFLLILHCLRFDYKPNASICLRIQFCFRISFYTFIYSLNICQVCFHSLVDWGFYACKLYFYSLFKNIRRVCFLLPSQTKT